MAETLIKTVAEFAKAISDIPLKKGYTRFFRGHADYRSYKLEPFVYRKPYLIENEEKLIKEAVLRCPDDFNSSSTFFERLVRLQHYGLPTRMLDLTSNALVALYFACRDKEKTEGEVIILDMPNDQVKYYDSDTVSVISNIARRDKSFDLSSIPSDKGNFNRHEEIERLLHDIRGDRPAFLPKIEPNDLSRIIAVRAKLENARIARQDGAFLLFGINVNKLSPAKIPDSWITCGNSSTRITFSNKHILKKELMSFGISEQSLFPELESQTKAIITHFNNKYERKPKP